MLKASINLIKDLKKQKRENSSLLFLDNIKIIKDAVNNGLKPKLLLVENEDLKVIDGCEAYKVDRKTIEILADTKTPQGVVCIAEYTQHTVKKPECNFLVLDRLQDPGNVGSLIRTATACGFDCVFLVDSVKINNPKLIRSSVGTIFQNKIYSLTMEEFVKLAKTWDLKLVMADMDGENVFEMDFPEILGLVVGNEGAGVSDQMAKLCSYSTKIPMKNGVESLNASVSGSIIMYQIANKNLKFKE